MYWTAGPTPRPIPDDGRREGSTADAWIVRTVDGKDESSFIRSFLRETDCLGVFTIRDEHGNLRWIRWDGVRQAWVRAYGQADGARIDAPPLAELVPTGAA